MPSKKDIVVLIGLTLFVATLLYLLDSKPRFFFGDSEAYLHTTINGSYPKDRSWLYGTVIRPLIETTGYFKSILMAQRAFRIASIVLLGLTVLYFTGWRIAAVVGILLAALDPLGLFMERSVLTDSLASSFFVALVCALALGSGGWTKRPGTALACFHWRLNGAHPTLGGRVPPSTSCDRSRPLRSWLFALVLAQRGGGHASL